MKTILLVMAAASQHLAAGQMGNCSVYTVDASSKCSDACGECFNPGGRPGQLCRDQGSKSGYYCEAFACMDWTFGSTYMRAAEHEFNKTENLSVYFGVGSFGSDDPMSGLGMCLRLAVEGVDRDIIVQSINTGGDVQGNQFDMQVGDGGFGANNKCAGGSGKMYPGTTATWGHEYGGVDNRSACSGLPKYPVISGPMKAAGDDLVTLCQYSFDKNARIQPPSQPSNPTIRNMKRVRCPPALVNATYLERTDDPAGYDGPSLPGFPNTAVSCQSSPWDLSFCLTRMMDCCKPSGAWKDNVRSSLTKPGKKVVQPCTSDGYTRYDVQCGCMDCEC
eukprot:TRINITY_DN27593_c0_g1_i1.p1 TRINITY_DN27593_c0_g1~~TRINITY_DN27593_c0_g1_i1.p1  ORF type:complete len:333 (+),score=30.61 TRINITY_DN27593_c0_g1_i1:72-1070(+)